MSSNDQHAASKALEQEALKLDSRRCEVLLAGDGAGLAAIVDEGLTYTHATGRRDTKATYVDSVSTGRSKYTRLDREEVTARAIGNTVLVEGKVNMTVVVEGVEKNLYNRYLGVWTAVSGKLLLTAWASTKLN